MKNTPKISIITVCYNASNLRHTCESVVSQTFQDFEWLVIDGGSNQEESVWKNFSQKEFISRQKHKDTLLLKHHPKMKKYVKLYNRFYGDHRNFFIFQIRVKPNKVIIRLFNILPLLKIQNNTVYLFAFIPTIKVKHHRLTLEKIKSMFKRSPINVFYFNSVSNFGDLLNIDIMHKLPKFSVKRSDPTHTDIVAVGSLLQEVLCHKMQSSEKISRLFRKPLIIYGSGFIYDTPNMEPVRKLDVRAVRGELSLAKLKSLKHVKFHKDLAIADPGLLAPLLTDVSNIKKKYDLGIIPHYVDKGNPLLEKIKVKNAVVLDIMQPPHIFLPQLAQCKTVISSAMHGLIAADSFGIPNVRMTLSDKITGGDYKYNDYYSAFGIKEHDVIDLRQRGFTDKDVKTIKEMYQIKPEQVRQKQKELLKAFPYKIKGKVCL